MPINVRQLPSGKTQIELIREILKATEAPGQRAYYANDYTITIGYGYTFLRRDPNNRWSVFGFLRTDMQAVNIALTGQELSMLGSIQDDLNAGTASRRTNAVRQIRQFIQNWNHPALSLADMDTLLNRQISRDDKSIESQFQRHLGEIYKNKNLGIAYGTQLFNTLQNSPEMVAIHSLAYGGADIVGPNLTRALWNGNRAEAWYEMVDSTPSAPPDI